MHHASTYALLAVLLLSACSPQRRTPRLRIGVSQCSDDEWRSKMNHEMQREALLHDGVEIVLRCAHDDARRQCADIAALRQMGCDLLIVAPVEAEAVTPAVEQTMHSGVPVVVFDRKTASDCYTAFIGADNVQIGRAAGGYISTTRPPSARQGTTLRVLEIGGLRGSTAARERHEGLCSALAEAGHVSVDHAFDADWLREKAQAEMTRWLREHDLRRYHYVFAANDRMALGARQAALQAGLKESELPKFVGVDAMAGTEAALQDSGGTALLGANLVERGVLSATFLYPTAGDSVLRLALSILSHQPYKKHNTLPSALVDKQTAHLLHIQTQELVGLDAQITTLNTHLSARLQGYQWYRVALLACVVVLLLTCALLVVVVRWYWMKRDLAGRLTADKFELEERLEQLLHLQRQLEEATTAKLQFYTNVSHDFRTPLTLIADPVRQLCADASLPEAARDTLSLVRRNVSILTRLVSQILDFRKYENGHLSAHRTPLDLAGSLRAWCESLRPLARRRNFSLSCRAEAGDWNVLLDAEKTERIVFNLLSNAFKYSPDGSEVCLTLRRDASAADSGRAPGTPSLLIVVSDNGQGIAPEHLGRLFERFYQVDEQHTGSGIGLALVKAFVEVQGGTITAQSQGEGHGTTFTVRLPLEPAGTRGTDGARDGAQGTTVSQIITPGQVSEELLTSSPLSSPGELGEGGSPPEADIQGREERPLLLVVDDNSDIRSYVRAVMQADYQVCEATNGAEGVEQALRLVPDVVVCDVMMPVMDGLACCRALKQEVRTSHIPVVMLTACALDEQRAEGYNCGADSYLSKPFSADVLRARLHNLLESRRQLAAHFAATQGARRTDSADGLAGRAAGDQGKSQGNSQDRSVCPAASGAQPPTPEAEPEPLSPVDREFTARLLSCIEEHMADSELSIDRLADLMHFSRVQLYRKTKALTGKSPTDLLRSRRLARAAQLLSLSGRTVSETAYAVGFSSPSYFTKCFREEFGHMPSEHGG